jgi:hypothetical protein
VLYLVGNCVNLCQFGEGFLLVRGTGPLGAIATSKVMVNEVLWISFKKIVMALNVTENCTYNLLVCRATMGFLSKGMKSG